MQNGLHPITLTTYTRPCPLARNLHCEVLFISTKSQKLVLDGSTYQAGQRTLRDRSDRPSSICFPMERAPLSPRRDDPKKRRVEPPTSSQAVGTHKRGPSGTGKPAPRKKDIFKAPRSKKGKFLTMVNQMDQRTDRTMGLLLRMMCLGMLMQMLLRLLMGVLMLMLLLLLLLLLMLLMLMLLLLLMLMLYRPSRAGHLG